MAGTERSTGQKVGGVLLWVGSGLGALGFLLAGATKFQPGGNWEVMFEGWGYAKWFLYLIGAVEVAGAILLLVPRFAAYAAGVLGAVLVGAIYTLVTDAGDMGIAAPAVYLVLMAVIGYFRWGRRWTAG
jgi:uncharacterized membrane protein YphA (DoxX/SURF4 family)